jgi:hypothetical protein
VLVPLPNADLGNPGAIHLAEFDATNINTDRGNGENWCSGKVTAKNGYGDEVFHYTSLVDFEYDGHVITYWEGFTGHGECCDWSMASDNAGSYPDSPPTTQAYFNAYGDFQSPWEYARAGAKENMDRTGKCSVTFTWDYHGF